jgi:tRNA 2-thiouridine synthesizing protein A
VAQDLRRHGYQAFALKGGYAAWEEAGYPTQPKKRAAKVTSMKDVRPDRLLDCIGLYCPTPVLNLRKEMDEISVGQIVEVWADDPAAESDFKAWAKRAGQKLLSVERGTEGMRFLFQKIA